MDTASASKYNGDGTILRCAACLFLVCRRAGLAVWLIYMFVVVDPRVAFPRLCSYHAGGPRCNIKAKMTLSSVFEGRAEMRTSMHEGVLVKLNCLRFPRPS